MIQVINNILYKEIKYFNYIMEEEISWKFIDSYFKDNSQCLVNHHIESYNDFFKNGIKRIFNEKNPIRILKTQDPTT